MSESAYKDSLAIELKQAAALKQKQLIFVFGNHGKKIALKAGFKEEKIVRMSNFVGFMLVEAKELDLDKIIILGHIGKIVKVAAGIFNTHSKKADARKEIIAAHAALLGATQQNIKDIFAANTAEEAAAYLLENKMQSVLNQLAAAVVQKTEEKLENKIKTEAVIFSLKQGIIALTQGAKEDFDFE
jgi:cobalt-precorrin-5B (C1)-methyltransferase